MQVCVGGLGDGGLGEGGGGDGGGGGGIEHAPSHDTAAAVRRALRHRLAQADEVAGAAPLQPDLVKEQGQGRGQSWFGLGLGWG